MAKAATADDVAADAPKKSKKMLFIILAVVLLVVVAAAAAMFMMAGSAAEEGDDEYADEMIEEDLDAQALAAKKAKLKKKKEAEAKGLPPVFVELDPFTVNLAPETQVDQYLQVKATVKVEEQSAADSMKMYMPEIRHHVLMLLSGKRASDLGTTEGREALAGEMKNSINAIVGKEPTNKKGEPKKQKEPVGPVEAVLFTSFIIQ